MILYVEAMRGNPGLWIEYQSNTAQSVSNCDFGQPSQAKMIRVATAFRATTHSIPP